MIHPVFLHVDLDAFFASVEQLDNPQYRNKPVIVGSLPTDKRGVVSTCSYEARTFGVHSAMAIFKAYKLCPQGIYVRGHMKRYHEKSRQVMKIFENYSPDVQQISVDEAFIDITGTEKLFGAPEETAKRLQAEVLDKTGLTVSIGIASSKYIAKIASDIHKPNGIYYVKHGDEEQFMSSIPLKDVWGIGQKTRQKLERSGLKTTKAVLTASQGMLSSIVGKNTALYLSNAVHGQMAEQFNQKPKSHSISSERTFPVDIKDTYIIETALMDLSYEIMFRMLNEGWNSKTAAIKIRYEDFTTVSAQLTTDRCIFSAEDLYERIVLLFYKKYEKGREIRLIGCGVQNLEKASVPQQAELFDLQNEKKQIVEKTIMKLQTKNSNLKIKKARLFTNNPATRHKYSILFAVLLPLFLFLNNTASASDFPSVLPVEDPEVLYEFSPDDENVEFYVEGSWDSSVSASSTLTFDSDNITFSQAPPIIENTVDITAWFLLLDTWYFEANVADDFDRNTVAAGYYGDGVLKHARIGNRYIDFSDIYGISKIGYGTGDTTTESPGFMTCWEGTDWKANSLIRYDLINNYDKKWTGLNEIDDDTISLDSYSKSLRFVLPPNVIDTVSEVLVETDNSNDSDYIDTDGIYYTALDSDEYMIFSSSNTIVFSTTHTDNILIRFYTNDDGVTEKATTETALGDWYESDGSTPSDSFLGNIANLFAIGAVATDTIIDLPELCGTDNSNVSDTDISSPDTDCFFVKTISSSFSASVIKSSGSWSMYLQRDGCFSPFADYSLYTTSKGTSATSVAIISESTEAVSDEFSASIVNESSLYGGSFTDTDFFDESFSVIQVLSDSETSTLARYPFAKTNPALYMGKDSLTDLEISVNTITTVTELNIGTDANESSIQVYRNGIKESSFVYDSDNGSVTLLSPPSTSDTIYISWSEYSDSSETGIITTALGYKKQLTDTFSYDISGSLFYPINKSSSFATLDNSTAFSTSIALNTTWITDSITLDNTISATVEQTNVLGKLQILGMSDDEPITLYLDSDAIIDDSSAYVTSTTARSSSDEGYKLTVDWDFSDATTNDKGKYTAYQCFEFAGSGDSIANAQEFILQISGLGADIFSNVDSEYTAYLQLGVSENGEYTSLSPIKELDPDDIDDNGYITLILTDTERNMIDDNTAARIIIQTNNLDDAESGELIIGTCYVNQTSFATNKPKNYTSTASKEVESPSDAGKEPDEMLIFTNDNDTNYVEQLSWKTDGTTDSVDYSAFVATKYTDNIPLDEYKYLNFFAYFKPTDTDDYDDTASNNYTITIHLDRQDTDGTHTALNLKLLPEVVSKLEDSWHTVSFNMVTQTLKIDGETINTSNFNSYVDTGYAPTRLKVSILPVTEEGKADIPSSSEIRSGSLFIDEFYLSDTTFEGKIIDVLDFSWTQQNALTNSNGFTFIDKTALYINSESFLATPDQYSTTNDADITTSAKLNTSIPLIDITVQTNSVASNNSDYDAFRLSGAGYTLNNNYLNLENTILKDILFLSDSTSLSADGIYIIGNRDSSVDFSFDSLNIPFTFSTSSLAKTKTSSATQDSSGKVTFSPKIGVVDTSFTTELNLYQKLTDKIVEDNTTIDTLTSEIATSTWMNLSELQFSSGESDASKIKTSLSTAASLIIPWISLKPQLSFTATNTNSNTNISKNTLDLSVPFTIQKQKFSMDFIKKCTTEEEVIKNGYVENYETWKNASISQGDFWMSFYTFYNQDLPDTLMAICADDSTIESLSTTSSANISWQRPIFASILDLFIPTSAATSFSRDIEASQSNFTDIYQLESTVGSTAFNCFGSTGTKPIFNWYKQDEYINTLSATFRFNSDSRTKIKTYSQAKFLINKDDYCSLVLQTAFDSNDSNEVELETSYTWNNDICFITDIFLYFAPQFAGGTHTAKRTEYFSLTVSKDNTDLSSDIYQDWDIKHTVSIKVTDFFSLYTTVEVETIYDDGDFSLTDSIALGGAFTF